jgi:hypothetical protein
LSRRKAILTPVVACLLACAHAAAEAPTAEPFSEAPLPHYLIRQAHGPVVIDGRLDEFDWATAPQIDEFTRILHDYGRILNPTRARMLWDADHLYVAFACRDRDMWALFTEEDDPMWSEEVVEAFIDPDGDGRDYLEVEINPLNAVVDLHIGRLTPEWVADKDWDIAGLRTAVRTHGTVNDSTDTDEGWTVEMAIPWAAFEPTIIGGGRPEVGDRWRLNLYRIERGAGAGAKARLDEAGQHRGRLEEQLAALEDGPGADRARLEDELARLEAETEPVGERYNQETEYTAWSPTFQRGFHHPERFGIVEFAPR